MAVSVVTRYPGLAAATYDQVIASLELDVNPPAGAILHVAGEGDDGVVISEIWQTEQTFRAYLDYRFQPALRMHGVHTSPLVLGSTYRLMAGDSSPLEIVAASPASVLVEANVARIVSPPPTGPWPRTVRWTYELDANLTSAR